MKIAKIILLTFLIATGLFGLVIFTACNKANCTGSVCQHGGACANGVCSCPTGYSGTFCQTAARTSLAYQNNTFTPITIAVNGIAATIPVGGSYAFSGVVGTDATGSASTSGAASKLGISTAGGILGLTIAWDINNTFPASDTQRVPLDVGSTYFFLRVANKSSLDVIDYYVNYGFNYGLFYLDATIPHDGVTYDMGYYLAYTYSNVQVQLSNNNIKPKWYAIYSLPFTSNQSVIVNVIN
jgi:hypothetical protein